MSFTIEDLRREIVDAACARDATPFACIIAASKLRLGEEGGKLIIWVHPPEQMPLPAENPFQVEDGLTECLFLLGYPYEARLMPECIPRSATA